MRARQRGVTFIGWLFLLAPIALVGYAGIQLTPIMLTYMRVARAIEQTAQQMETEDSVDQNKIRVALQKRFDIDYVDYPTMREVSIRKDGTGWIIETQYEGVAPLFANASILVQFQKSATIQ